ncbi:sirohydrochlorin cobaltochelatase [Lawsonibacter faecis]|uniref:Sirohydrochlorin cobaltochelatase n=1 Tax=Lawsonibacter faecis TaxID=2763052 RepID=A0A8J6ME42_9FIRM|nr:sirohydrochlorin cobaltochelatase [Lawsonibacter faecis]MBC5738664.1 sirohydrochlorin cobaltochelatase [Lawsonibacter faecis]
MDEKKAILAVSFGTSHADTLARTIGAIEAELAAAFPKRAFRRAFTSGMICRKLKARDGLDIPSAAEALEDLLREGCTDVVIQPTHVINGEEYDKLLAQAEPCRSRFARLSVGAPLLTTVEDYHALAAAVLAELPEEREDTAMIFMGHGTEHYVNPSYAQLEYVFHDLGRRDVLIGTVEGYPALEQVLRRMAERPEVKRAVLCPLMVVAGDHAKNDLAGADEDSWKSRLESLGYEVLCNLKGLGEYRGVREMFVGHALAAAGEE